MRLRANERCPVHNSYFCCGRERKRKDFKRPAWQKGPVRRVEDITHPRGYREICVPSELRRRKHELIAADPRCWICGQKFEDYRDIELEHREPKGMGSARRDDHKSNLALSHRICNFEKGSKRIKRG